MGFKEITGLETDTTVSLGGLNKKTGKNNPTSLEGYYVGSKSVPSLMSKTGLAQLHVFQTDKGNVGLWGKTDLDRKMRKAILGEMMRISLNGKAPPQPGKMPMIKFKVDRDPLNTIEVESQQSVAEETANPPTGSSFESAYAEEETHDAEEYADLDEVPSALAVAPKVPAAAPSAARQAKVQELLAKSRK